MPDFIPAREADLVNWSADFSAFITATPTAVGLTAGQASGYATLNTDFASAYDTTTNNATRTPAAIVAKNDAKEALIASARQLVAIIQAYPGTTNEQRSALKITVPSDEPTPIPVPENPPTVEIISAVQRTLRIRLWDSENPTNRGKPEGVSQAGIFTFVGASAPTDPAAYKFEGLTTRTVTEIQFADSVPSGATVWTCACWYNPRGLSGPACSPVMATIPGGAAVAA